MTALECGVKLPHAIPSLDNWVHLYLAFSAADKGTDCPIIIMRVDSIDSLFLNFANPGTESFAKHGVGVFRQ